MLQCERFELYDSHQNSTLRKLRAMTGNSLEVYNLPLAIVHKQLTMYQLDLVLKRLLPLCIALRNLVAFLCKSPCFLQIKTPLTMQESKPCLASMPVQNWMQLTGLHQNISVQMQVRYVQTLQPMHCNICMYRVVKIPSKYRVPTAAGWNVGYL